MSDARGLKTRPPGSNGAWKQSAIVRVTDRFFAMTPIHEVLNRIRWDPDFGRGNFELGYHDRVEGRVIVVPFREVEFSEDDPQAFRLVDTEGRSHRVPFHRVREVYKDGQRIWHRSPVAK
ncbi:MAG: DUF504 domain-containing protein [Limisphaerales bacterium]